jgi:archaemetzincin
MICIVQQKGLDLFDTVVPFIKSYIKREAQNKGSFELPAESYNALRQQYSAEHILTCIAHTCSDPDYNLGIVSVDIYTHRMNFIFGLADPRQKTAVVSTFRLAGENTNERIGKEVIHELGHLMGLQHCDDRKCVMHFSNTINDTDYKGIEFCRTCRSMYE